MIIMVLPFPIAMEGQGTSPDRRAKQAQNVIMYAKLVSRPQKERGTQMILGVENKMTLHLHRLSHTSCRGGPKSLSKATRRGTLGHKELRGAHDFIFFFFFFLERAVEPWL